MNTETIDELSAHPWGSDDASHPGIFIVHSGEQPQRLVLPLEGGALELGRDELAAAGIPDARMSRRHLRVEIDAEGWTVHDLGSRNGTFVDGRQVQVARRLRNPVVRVGRTLLLPVGDRRPYESPGVTVQAGVVTGPTMASFYERITLIAQSGANLLINGNSGTGKELAANAFHAAGDKARPFVAVNCATIQREIAERILFGARRGAYTGAVADAVGVVQAADRGTLFLDEVAELDLAVQAKLLRVLETKRVAPLGSVTDIAVDVRLCAATHKDLRAEVAAGRFREDLYFRIGRPALRLPPLRERREEIPWLIEQALAAQSVRVTAGAEFIEACLLRAWPGNVRELLAEAKTAAVAAVAARRGAILASDLDDEAGRVHGPNSERSSERFEEKSDTDARSEAPAPDTAAIEAALRAEQGNVARAAARLGLARSKLRRAIERQGIDVKALRSG
ncbi:Response regulator of zinc sigma-54-dependent two-component system [Minicystis rosea]|nr:Response regulator of zinc sigma-54-dependent two-component system [Minicystis rosea]